MSNRDYWTQRIEFLGGKVNNSVSKNTDLVIVGDSPGSNKIAGAHKHGVPTLWFPFAEYCTLLDHRNENHLTILPKDFISQLSVIMSTLAEDLYVLYSHTRLERHRFASIRAAGAVRALLDSTYGPIVNRDRTSDS